MYYIPEPKDLIQPKNKETTIKKMIAAIYIAARGNQTHINLTPFFSDVDVDDYLKYLNNNDAYSTNITDNFIWQILKEFKDKGYYVDGNYHSYDRMYYGPLTLCWKS
jgi:hypothetical protein